MRVLTAELLAKIIKEETAYVDALLEGSRIAKGTKVRHTKSQILYTVEKDVDGNDTDVMLRTPEEKIMMVKKDEFADEYNLS